MDRVIRDGEVVTAMSLASLIDALPHTRHGAPDITLFDVHDPHERFYFHNGALPEFETTMPYFHQYLRQEGGGLAKVAICFPDEGAFKRYGCQFPSSLWQRIFCHKTRDGKKRNIKIIEGNPRGRRVWIVDDLMLSCATLLECGDALLRKGAVEVNAYAPHGVCPNHSWRKFLKSRFTRVVITDSCPLIAHAVQGTHPFHVLPLAPELAKLIQPEQERLKGA